MVEIPSISGFSPYPIGMMIPFMEAQSAGLARAFGLNYEMGKRQIKSMSNEEFNALTEEGINTMLRTSTTAQLQLLYEAIPQFRELQTKIIDEYKEIEKLKIQATFDMLKEIVSDQTLQIDQSFWNLIGLGQFSEANRQKNTAPPLDETYEEYQEPPSQQVPPSRREPTPNTQKTADQQAIQKLHTDIIRLAKLHNELQLKWNQARLDWAGASAESQAELNKTMATIKTEQLNLNNQMATHSAKEFALQENYKVKYGNYYAVQ